MKLLKPVVVFIKYFARIVFVSSLVSIIFFTEQTQVNNFIVKVMYQGFEVLKSHWIWCIVLLFTPYFVKKCYHWHTIVAKEIRSQRLHTEIERYLNTPYISPLHLLYMLKPPRWIKEDHGFSFRDRLYREATDAFRDIVYEKFQYKHFKPTDQPAPFWKMLNKLVYKRIGLSVLIASLSCFVIAAYPRFVDTSVNYALLLVPLLLRHVLILFHVFRAIINFAPYNKVAKLIKDEFGTLEPNVKWFDLYANTAKGQRILTIWKNETALRQNRDSEHRKSRLDLSYPTSYNSTLRVNFELEELPACPFPSSHIPVWYDEYNNYINKELLENNQFYVNQFLNKVSIPSTAATSTNVIDLDTIRKHKHRT